ncbi:PREDICTED: FBD-associated F-box protein At3g49020-like [Camelina sativa]|uniref:FBD-associated F-box protein At3g49020-like n=1 Tax=Camelina sativa TaxID=90675 RepID=A0ABM0YXA7_CAMSA|nr:PREDICTED: FBD-associated F-box protein At3g49020-like [Camelina sativa]
MEQKGKTGGEGLRNGDVVNKDKISELPEDLLLHILSSLPTEIAITTSVLSKRWRSLWTLVPNLKFDSEYHYRFSENVCRSLILHKALVLESFHLRVEYERDASDVGILVGIAFARHLRKLVLTFEFQDEGSVRFPSVLCIFNNTLEILKLEGSILLDLPSPGCFKSLRELHLYYVHFKDEKSVCNLLCGCPSLEDLVVHISDNVETFTVAVPSLQRLTINDSYPEEGKGGYVINAPSLKYLNLKGIHRVEFCLIENAVELVEAKISDVSYITNENILETLTHTKRLSLNLSPLQITYPIGKIFDQLLYLELRTNRKEWRNLLSLMLDRSPKLQILKLIDPYHFDREDSLNGQEWNQPTCVPECLLFHLETFLWTGYEWQLEDEKEVATYILKNARRLKKATLSTKPIESKELEKLEKRRQMLNELTIVVRASNSCHLVCEADTYSWN